MLPTLVGRSAARKRDLSFLFGSNNNLNFIDVKPTFLQHTCLKNFWCLRISNQSKALYGPRTSHEQNFFNRCEYSLPYSERCIDALTDNCSFSLAQVSRRFSTGSKLGRSVLQVD